MKVIGRAKVNPKNLKENLYQWIVWAQSKSAGPNGRNPFWAKIYDEYRETEYYKLLDTLYQKCFSFSDFSIFRDENEDDKTKYRKRAENVAKEYLDMIHRAEEYDIPVKCLVQNDLFVVVTLGSDKSSMMLPPENVTVTPYRDYNELTAAERKMMLTGKTSSNTSSVAVYGGSVNEARTAAETIGSDIQSVKRQMEDVKAAKSAELAALQKEIDEKMAVLEAKKQSMMAELQSKMDAMQLQMDKMNLQIHLLDSEIYAIRCYTGEIVEFHQIRKGMPAAQDTPIVFYQKMRYLDEELGKLASIYSVDFEDHKIFEDLLKYSPHALEVFAPSSRSIMLARVSKSNKQFYSSEEYGNMLKDCEVYHGKRICIILRDGENLWTAWTDDDRVDFPDDAFLKPSGPREMTDTEKSRFEKYSYETDEQYEKRMRQEKMNELDRGISRIFVFSILQGVMDRGMIRMPEKFNVTQSGKHIVFSYADGWLTDNRYGSLTDIIKKCNSDIAKKDYILTVQSLRPDASWSGRSIYSAWYNDRGRGDKNRTHDVHASDRTVYPINLVEHEAKYKIIYSDNTGDDGEIDREEVLTDEELQNQLRNGRFGHYHISSYEKIEDGETKYYISLKKSENWMTGESARANFQVYTDEFWNLTFMNSVWLEYILSTQKTGNVHIGGAVVDFAHVIPYLKTALEHVRDREKEVAEWLKEIAPTILKDTEWPVKLSEWMLKNHIHNFSKFRVKQFAKSLKSGAV